MSLYTKLLNDDKYLEVVKKIEGIKFITDGKWDWEHGLGHYKRVANYMRKILKQLNVDERTIELGMVTALLHDISLIKGDKTNHAEESSMIFTNFINEKDFSTKEIEILSQAICDHSNGNNIKTLVGLSLVLADKMDITYHRTINSSIQDYMNKQIQKIKEVDIEITNDKLILKYTTDYDFDVEILKDWEKAINVPQKAANYLNKKFIFLINKEEIDINTILKNTN